MTEEELVKEYIKTAKQQLNNIDQLIKDYKQKLEIEQYKQKLLITAHGRLLIDLMFFRFSSINLPGGENLKDILFPVPEPPMELRQNDPRVK